jgi:HSP20 family protein
MKFSSALILLLPAMGCAFNASPSFAKPMKPMAAVKEGVEKKGEVDEPSSSKKMIENKSEPEEEAGAHKERRMSLRSPFMAMDRFFDDDFFELTTPRSMMDRFDQLDRMMFSPMPLLRGLDRDSNSILRRSSPAYEISEDEKQFKLSVDLPGVRPEDCNVELENEGKVLHLYGGRKIENENGFSETRFDQRFTLGKNLDSHNISANLADGVMVVTAPKLNLEEPPKTRSISITSNPHSNPASEL